MAKIRSEVSENLKWKLTDIFNNDEEFKALLKEVEGKMDFSKYEGKLSDEKTLLECLKALDKLENTLKQYLKFYLVAVTLTLLSKKLPKGKTH